MYRIAKDIQLEIDGELNRMGLLFRIFFRVKETYSASQKIKRKGYQKGVNMLQDHIGIRITTYFKDDLELIKDMLKNKFLFVSETIDTPAEDEFRPTRINLIFRLSEAQTKEFSDTILKDSDCIDSTFEIQLRTVLSEGWHEVDHDLRYKCKDDWNNHSDLSRALNGIYATLETSDWSMINLFDQLAYRNYKNRNWQAMLRNKFRIRFSDVGLNQDLIECFNEDKELIKNIYKIDRQAFLECILRSNIRLPITYDNIIYLINVFIVRNEKLRSKTPREIYELINAQKSLINIGSINNFV